MDLLLQLHLQLGDQRRADVPLLAPALLAPVGQRPGDGGHGSGPVARPARGRRRRGHGRAGRLQRFGPGTRRAGFAIRTGSVLQQELLAPTRQSEERHLELPRRHLRSVSLLTLLSLFDDAAHRHDLVGLGVAQEQSGGQHGRHTYHYSYDTDYHTYSLHRIVPTAQ